MGITVVATWVCEASYTFGYDSKDRLISVSYGQPFNLPSWKQMFLYKKTFYAWIKPTGTFTEENIWPKFIFL